jgi:hypothetical protein
MIAPNNWRLDDLYHPKMKGGEVVEAGLVPAHVGAGEEVASKKEAEFLLAHSGRKKDLHFQKRWIKYLSPLAKGL